MSSTVEQIKEKLSIQEVVSSYIKLEKAGKNFRAKCPFHNEKTPSFFVSPERGSYYCFGCGAKGDVFSFVQEFEGLDFVGSLKLLADRAGVEIEYANPEAQGEKERMLKAIETATQYFEDEFSKNDSAKKYLLGRGLVQDTLNDFRIGYIQNEWRKLHTHLSDRGFTDDEQLRAGLIKKSDKGDSYYDVFRGRILFPILDPSGRVIAFSGRVFETDDPAKYLNSPETLLFRKSQILYGYDKARGAMHKYDFCILVEGQTDVLMSHQAGFMNTVAALGTSLTEDHLKKIKRLTGNLVLALDADGAGIASAKRGTELALNMGFDVKVAKLPNGKDPAEVIHESSEAWKSAIRESKHIVDFLIDILEETHKDERKFHLEIRKTVLPYVAMIDNKIDQGHFVKKLSRKLAVSEDAVYQELNKVDSLEIRAGREDAPEESEAQKITHRRDAIIEKLLGVMLWQKTLDEPQIDIESIEKKFLEVAGLKTIEEAMGERGSEELIFEAETAFGDSIKLEQYVQEMLVSLEEDSLRSNLVSLMSDLRGAERDGNPDKATNILKQYQAISSKIENIKDKMKVFNN